MSQLYTTSYYNHRLNIITNIPDELIVEILKWVPSKSLVRFMSVCKSWYNLISSPEFKFTHLKQQLNISNIKRYTIYNYAIFYYDTYLVYCDDHDHEFTKHFELICKESEAIPVGYCDGVVCLIDNVYVYLWNPSLGKYLGIRVPHTLYEFGGLCADGVINRNFVFVFGFGFDGFRNDHKLVCIAYMRCNSPKTMSLGVYVYSLSEGCWKIVDASFEWDDECMISVKAVYLNGVIHWVVERNDAGDDDDDHFVPDCVLRFNLADETFSEMKLPKDKADVPRVSDSDLNDRVNLMTVKRNGREFLAALRSDPVSIELWVLDWDDVVKPWREVFSITRDASFRCFENVTTNGELVLQLKEGSMVSLNLTSMRMKRISNRKMNYVGTYVESLVLLKPERAFRGADRGNFVH